MHNTRLPIILLFKEDKFIVIMSNDIEIGKIQNIQSFEIHEECNALAE
jgi:hypothetical protein